MVSLNVHFHQFQAPKLAKYTKVTAIVLTKLRKRSTLVRSFFSLLMFRSVKLMDLCLDPSIHQLLY